MTTASFARKIDDILGLDSLQEQKEAVTPEVKEEILADYIEYQYNNCPLVPPNWSNNYGMNFKDWDRNLETVPVFEISVFKEPVPIVTGLPLEEAKLMEMVAKGDLHLALSSGTSNGPNGPRSRIFRDKKTLTNAAKVHGIVLKDYAHMGESGESEVVGLATPPPKLISEHIGLWFPDIMYYICKELGNTELIPLWEKWEINPKTRKPMPTESFDEYKSLERVIEIAGGRRINLVGASHFINNMARAQNERHPEMELYTLITGGGFKDPKLPKEEIVAQLKGHSTRLYGKLAVERFTDCIGLTEADNISCSPRKLDAGLMQEPPYIEYLTPIHPLVHWQVRDKKSGKVLKKIGARGELVQINPTALSYPAVYCQGDEVEITDFQNNEPVVKYVGRIEGKGKAPGCADFMVEMDEAVKAGRLK